jgi:uncharacterized membrane protein YvbJ
MAIERIYAVENEEEQTLVKATGQAAALGHVVKGKYTVRPASAMDVLNYLEQGGVVEDATKPQAATSDLPESAPTAESL